VPDRSHFGAARPKLLLALTALLLCAGSASAYVGPGAGLEFIGYSLGLLMWAVGAFSAVALWPIYAFIRWLRGSRAEPPQPEQPPPASTPPP